MSKINYLIDLIDEDLKLKELIEGKRVCFCGPASSNIDSGYGELIDSYDIVCRVNWHLTSKDGWKEELIKDFGKKTDIMFSNVGPFYKCFYNDIVNRNNIESPYHCFKDLKYVYFTDPINLPEFLSQTKEYFKINKDKYMSESKDFMGLAYKINLDFGVCNRYLQNIDNLNYMKENMNLENNITEPMTNSGIHAIQVILKHKPKELFITGMNFCNFSQGGKQEQLYANGSTQSKYIPKEKFEKKIFKIHTYPITLQFFKNLINEYDQIKLDLLLDNFFDKYI